jgi:hypothetical protein
MLLRGIGDDSPVLEKRYGQDIKVTDIFCPLGLNRCGIITKLADGG